MATADPVLDVRGISKTYAGSRVPVSALRGVTFQVETGRSTAIMGPSGSGKTTLLNIIAGLDRPTTGEVWVNGTRLDDLDIESATAFRRRHIGFVFQFFNLLPTMTARQNVQLPLLAERLPRREIEARASAMIEAVGLTHRAEHRPNEMSGGEQQRVAVARALVMTPRLLLADEPTGNLDSVAGEEIIALLRDAASTFGLSIVVVTHSYLTATAMDRIATMRDGVLVEGAELAPQGSEPRSKRLGLVPPGRGGQP